MVIEHGSFQISFPWKGDLPAAEVIVLKDVDIIGVGSLRRHQLEQLKAAKTLLVQTHEALIPEDVYNIYQAELLRTLECLRPFKTEKVDDWSFIEAQKVLFSKLFPQVENTLGVAAHKLRDEYLTEMPWSSWLLQDHWRYFAGFLRQKFPDYQELLDLAHWEWVQAWIEIQPFDLSSYSKSIHVELNPSLQIVNLRVDNPMLDKKLGMYAFAFDHTQNVVTETQLDIYQAYLLDLIQEDRKFTKAQLIEMALIGDEISPQLSSEQWYQKLTSLQEAGVVSAE